MKSGIHPGRGIRFLLASQYIVGIIVVIIVVTQLFGIPALTLQGVSLSMSCAPYPHPHLPRVSFPASISSPKDNDQEQ